MFEYSKFVSRLHAKYRNFLVNIRDTEPNSYDSSVEEYEQALRQEFVNLTPTQRVMLFKHVLAETKNELEDCFVENDTMRALELMIVEQLLSQVVKD